MWVYVWMCMDVCVRVCWDYPGLVGCSRDCSGTPTTLARSFLLSYPYLKDSSVVPKSHVFYHLRVRRTGPVRVDLFWCGRPE